MQQKNPPPRSSVANKVLWCLMPWGHVLSASGPLKQVWRALLPLPHVLEHSLSSGRAFCLHGVHTPEHSPTLP